MHVPAVGAKQSCLWGRCSFACLLVTFATFFFLTSVTALAQPAAEQNAELNEIASAFGWIRIWLYVSVAVGLILGGCVFVLLRRRFRRFPMVLGIAVAVTVAVGGYWASSRASGEVATCAGAQLNWGDRADDYDKTCAASRERPANALLGIPVFRFFSRVDSAEPLSGRTAWWVALISIVLVTPLLLLASRPLLEKWFVRN